MNENKEFLEDITTKTLVLARDLNMILDLSEDSMPDANYQYLKTVSYSLEMIAESLAEKVYEIKNS